jgi:hypothetical protein
MVPGSPHACRWDVDERTSSSVVYLHTGPKQLQPSPYGKEASRARGVRKLPTVLTCINHGLIFHREPRLA